MVIKNGDAERMRNTCHRHWSSERRKTLARGLNKNILSLKNEINKKDPYSQENL
jgi:hypothetical protein